MLGSNGLPYAVTDENQTSYQEQNDRQFIFLETLETEERNLCVQQETAD